MTTIQTVHLGRSESGTPGFFTGNVLTLRVDEKRFCELCQDRTLAEHEATKYGFKLEESKLSEGDKNVVRNLRFRWREQLAGYTDEMLADEYANFACSDLHGNNDENFLIWLQ